MTLSTGRRTVVAHFRAGPSIGTRTWPPGHYLLRVDSSRGYQTWVPLTVRSPSTRGRVVLVAALNTWQVYNHFGNYSAYTSPAGFARRSYAVSFDRPYDFMGIDHFFAFERPLWARAEALGIPLAFTTDVDVSVGRTSVRGAAAIVFPGHAEYWSTALRSTILRARDHGTNLFFAGANTMYWRIRYENTGLGRARRIVIYKSKQDPIYGRHNRNVTVRHRDPPRAFPENRLIGMLYVCFPAFGDYRVETPDFWAFRGTGVRRGTTFASLASNEVDRAFLSRNTPRPMRVVAHSQVTCSGTRRIADSTYYTTRSGSGVFAVGTLVWVNAMANRPHHGITPAGSAFVKQVTDNVLTAFAQGPAARKHPAHDNLRAIYG